MNKKICVIGAGYWGKNHIRTLNNLNNLYGIVELNSNLQSINKKLYPNAIIFNSLDKALNDQNIDGFIVATPAVTHFEISKKIIISGKSLLVEKPFTLNVKDAEELKRLSIKHKVNVMVGHVLLFHPAIVKIKQMINEGIIGELQYIYSNRLNLGQIRKEENVFWSLAPHDISIFQYLIESYPIKISSNGGEFIQKKIHDTTITFFDYPKNIKAHIFVSWLHPFKEHRIIIIGSKGMLTFEDSSVGKPLKLFKKGFKLNGSIPEKNDGPIEEIEYDNKMALTEELNYFINNLNQKFNISGIDCALEVTKILITASKGL